MMPPLRLPLLALFALALLTVSGALRGAAGQPQSAGFKAVSGSEASALPLGAGPPPGASLRPPARAPRPRRRNRVPLPADNRRRARGASRRRGGAHRRARYRPGRASALRSDDRSAERTLLLPGGEPWLRQPRDTPGGRRQRSSLGPLLPPADEIGAGAVGNPLRLALGKDPDTPRPRRRRS